LAIKHNVIVFTVDEQRRAAFHGFHLESGHSAYGQIAPIFAVPVA
jgi:hypothetical protein